MSERRALQIVVALASLVPICAGAMGVLLGSAMIDVIGAPASIDPGADQFEQRISAASPRDDASRPQAALRLVRARRIDIEVDDFDAALRPSMAIAAMPRPIAKLNVADPGQKQAAPLTSRRQTRFASAAKLIGERFFFSPGVAEDDRAEFAGIAVVGTEDLFAGRHGLSEQLIGGASKRRFFAEIHGR
jgi:hypothetical protein